MFNSSISRVVHCVA